MESFSIQRRTRSSNETLTLRDAIAPVFRQRRLALVIFIGILGGAALAASVAPQRYEAEMKILVNRDRADDVVTPNPDTRIVSSQAPSVTEQDLNSEVELLKSRDLLQKVVMACGLQAQRNGLWQRMGAKFGPQYAPQEIKQRQVARAVDLLKNRIIAEPLKNTSLIRVTYTSPNPELSAQVLRTLATLYKEKHAEVHRPAGAFKFFDREARHYRDELTAREARLQDFDAAKGLVDPQTQEQLLLQRIGELQTELDQNRASIRADHDRVAELKAKQSASPERRTTVVRKSDNGELLAQLNSTLLSLELKRRDMLTKYAPDYPLVTETNAQIDDARKALALALKTPVKEVTTDRTPEQDWMATEMTKAEADQASLKAQDVSIQQELRDSQVVATQIDRDGELRQDLARDKKTSEDNYILYVRKREEARISDLLDQQRIVNISVAEAAMAPAFPQRTWPWILAFGFFGAGAASVGAAFAADHLDPTFRTPDELGRYLDLKVLAAIPQRTFKQ
ncbi:MAG: GumC family protein [Candidatus Acidiferrales bacterium]